MTNIKTFVTSAAKCKTVSSLKNLLKRMQAEVLAYPLLSPLEVADYEIELVGGTQPFLRFELNQVISQHYITLVRFEIRDGKFSARICTNRMKDGLGMFSRSWEPLEALDDDLTISDKETVATLADKIYTRLMENHRELLETVGLDRDTAYQAACAAWRTKYAR